MSQPPPFDQIPIAFLYKTGRLFEADCLSCGGRQSVHFPSIIKKFGSTKTLANVAGQVECFICHEPGIKVFEVNVGR